MDWRAWLILAVYVVWFGSTYFKVRRARRLGTTQSYGHPLLDSLLLLGSALLLISTLALAFRVLHGETRVFTYILMIGLGGALTYFCNAVLRKWK